MYAHIGIPDHIPGLLKWSYSDTIRNPFAVRFYPQYLPMITLGDLSVHKCTVNYACLVLHGIVSSCLLHTITGLSWTNA